jgi:hypothetical protein
VNLKKALYGVLAFWYFLFAAEVLIFPGVLQSLTYSAQRWAGCGFGVALIGSWVAYLVDIFRNPFVPVQKRPFWALAVGLLGPLAMPFYFFRYIAGTGQPAPPASPAFSGWAHAAGYLGVLSVFVTPAPLSIITAALALNDLRRHPEKRGRNRAIFGLVMGLLGTAGLALFLARYA